MDLYQQSLCFLICWEIGNLENQLHAANMEHENRIQEFKKRDSQVHVDMEAQVHRLRGELVSMNSQQKQQLVELGLLWEEEKQRAARDHEATVNKLKAESEKMRLELKKTHAAKTELMLEKASSRLKQIEKEYTQKLAKSSQVDSLLSEPPGKPLNGREFGQTPRGTRRPFVLQSMGLQRVRNNWVAEQQQQKAA